MPTLDLVDRVINAVGPVMVLAAGGIADGAGVAEALAHGADGVWVGTRLVASTEAYAHDNFKQRIVNASQDDSVITTMFGPEWAGQPIRVLRNQVVDEWAGRESQIPAGCEQLPSDCGVIGQTLLFGTPYTMPKFSAIIPTPDTTGDFEQMCLPAGGQSAALVHEVKPAGEIIMEMMQSAHAIMRAQI